jgi:hypothetical protein
MIVKTIGKILKHFCAFLYFSEVFMLCSVEPKRLFEPVESREPVKNHPRRDKSPQLLDIVYLILESKETTA